MSELDMPKNSTENTVIDFDKALASMQHPYILVGKKPVLAESSMEMALFLDTDESIVGNDEKDGIKVSTIFRGLCGNYGKTRRPLLFETVVQTSSRQLIEHQLYARWDEAETGHQEMIDKYHSS